MHPGRTLLRLAAGLEWPISGQALIADLGVDFL
jgi:hypothetical protein